MRNTSLVFGALAVQAVIVTVMIVKAVMPLWTGRDVLVAARPVDPRDLMRGDYVALSYEFNRLRVDSLKTDLMPGEQLRYGDVLCVTLKATDSGAVATGVFKAEPASEQFIRGRCSYAQSITGLKGVNGTTLMIDYGIEEYYTDSETAKRLELQLQHQHSLPVHIKIDNSGNARISQLGHSQD